MRVTVSEGHAAFSGPLSASEVVYVDADQLPTDGVAEIEVLAVPVGTAVDDRGPAALALLVEPVRRALASVGGSVEVVGNGALARCLRAEVVSRRPGERPPDVIVDLSGDPHALADVVRRVADLGAIVLAGDPAGRAVDIDFYPDVHVRGLRLIGCPAVEWSETLLSTPPVSSVPDAPAEARVGRPVPLGAQWYRVSA